MKSTGNVSDKLILEPGCKSLAPLRYLRTTHSCLVRGGGGGGGGEGDNIGGSSLADPNCRAERSEPSLVIDCSAHKQKQRQTVGAHNEGLAMASGQERHMRRQATGCSKEYPYCNLKHDYSAGVRVKKVCRRCHHASDDCIETAPRLPACISAEFRTARSQWTGYVHRDQRHSLPIRQASNAVPGGCLERAGAAYQSDLELSGPSRGSSETSCTYHNDHDNNDSDDDSDDDNDNDDDDDDDSNGDNESDSARLSRARSEFHEGRSIGIVGKNCGHGTGGSGGSGRRQSAVVINGDRGRPVAVLSNLVIDDNQNHECYADAPRLDGSSTQAPRSDPQRRACIRDLVARVLLLATNLAVAIRERGHKSNLHFPRAPASSPTPPRTNPTTRATKTPGQQASSRLNNQPATSAASQREDYPIETKEGRQNKREREESKKTNLVDIQRGLSSIGELGHHQKQICQDGALCSGVRIDARVSEKPSIGGSGVLEQCECERTGIARMTTSASVEGTDTSIAQQLEEYEKPFDTSGSNRTSGNKNLSKQQIRQKHFSLARSSERRRVTQCSQLDAMTATDLKRDSSIVASGNEMNFHSDPVSQDHQRQQSMIVASSMRRTGAENTIVGANSRCALHDRPGCVSASTSSGSTSMEQQTSITLTAKPSGDPCRITFIPNQKSPTSTPEQIRNKPAKTREFWDKNIEFLLAVIGFAVDLGNIWRFPYICYKNGGGAFLVPYTIMFIFGGLPIFYMELSLGQYFSSGCLTVWRRVCPMAKGIGYAMCILNFFTGLYYNTIISWAVFYFVESFTLTSLPWTSCNNSWNSHECTSIGQKPLASDLNKTGVARTVYSSPTKDYFEREVLKVHLSTGIDNLGSIRTSLAIYLAIVFICVYFAIWKGVKSTGKAVWITALLPYFVLIPLLIRGVLLEGSMLGIKYYVSPKWVKILEPEVWIEASKQIYFSLGPGFGTLMALSSYNKFNHNCRRDALITAAVNYFASFIAGLVIFAVLGYMATIGNISIDEVATEGPGLVFQIYPEGLAMMRFSALWSILFFTMVISLGIDSTFGGLESVITGLCDEYPRVLRAHRGVFIAFLIIMIYICSLPTATYGGSYVIGLLEAYGTSLSLLFIVVVETIVVCWIYGTDKFCSNLKEMYGETPGLYWRICWKYISPTILILIFIAACFQEVEKYYRLTVGDYVYPGWAPTLGLLMTSASACCVPIYAVYYIKFHTSGSLYERLKTGLRPEKFDQAPTEFRRNTHLDTDI